MWAPVLQGSLLLILFITASAIDMKTREIPDGINIMIALTGLLAFSPAKLAGILIALPFLITAMLYKGRMGGGDIKFMAATGFAIGFEASVAASIIGLTACLLYCGVRHMYRLIFCRGRELDKGVPLAPFLGIGCMAAFILCNFGV